MIIRRVEIENILSIESAIIDIPDSGMMLIDGWNHDTESANGAGKSSIFTALCWGLFGEYPRGVSVSEIVRTGTRKAKVVVEAEVSGEKYVVERYRPNATKFFKRDDEITESEFYAGIGVTYEQFLLAQYFAQGLGSRFLDLNDTGRKDLILKLMKADNFAVANNLITVKLKQLETELSLINSDIATSESRVEAYKESIVDIPALQKRHDDLESLAQKCMAKLKEMDKPVATDISNLNELLSRLNKELESLVSLKGSASVLRNQLKAIDLENEPDDKFNGESCPSCKSKLNITAAGKLELHDHSSAANNLKAFKDKQNLRRITINTQLSEIESKLLKEQGIRDAIGKCHEAIATARAEDSRSSERYREIKTIFQNSIKDIESVRASLDKLLDLQNKSRTLEERITVKTQEAVDIAKQIDLLKVSGSVLSPTGIPAYIMDALVASFNDKISEYCQYIGKNLNYQLKTFRESKSGNVTAKMSDHLTIDGEVRSIGGLSGGERKCLSLAIDFALLDIVSQYTGATLSPVILDEPFDHLDVSNRQRAIELLKAVSDSRGVVVVDHASESKALFDKTVMVNKRGGISSVVIE